MTNEILHFAQIIISVLTAAASGLLGVMFWNSSLTSAQRFTAKFLKILALCAALKAIEVGAAAYRTVRIAATCVPLDASITGLLGRGFEMAGYLVLIWFLLQPETKRKLNGNKPMAP